MGVEDTFGWAVQGPELNEDKTIRVHMEGVPANQTRHTPYGCTDPKITNFYELDVAETSLKKNCLLCSSKGEDQLHHAGAFYLRKQRKWGRRGRGHVYRVCSWGVLCCFVLCSPRLCYDVSSHSPMPQ